MMPPKNDNTSQPNECVACCETLKTGAKICPYCGASQRFFRFKHFGLLLTWLGSVVTVISLVVGVITLNQFYQEWLERDTAITEIVESAEWLIGTDNYQQAWKMYDQAVKLSPSSPLVRDARFKLAKMWVRHFYVEKELLKETLNELTEVLYRGLPSATHNEVPTILAHIGYIQVIRKINRLPITLNVDDLFNQALSGDKDNVYANTMYARWVVLQKPLSSHSINQSAQLFDHALAQVKSGDIETYRYVRQLQLKTLANFTYGQDNTIEISAMTSLINAVIEMHANGEVLPEKRVKQNLLDGYGRIGRGDNIEAILKLIPYEKHLLAYQWINKNTEETRAVMQAQSLFIQARLLDLMGDKTNALSLYRATLTKSPRKEIEKQATDAIAQLSR